MKRTREKNEVQDEEDVRSQLFDSEVTPAMRAGGSRIVCEPSYVPVESLVFGRLAFKVAAMIACIGDRHQGMNAEIESMMAAAQAAAEEGKEEADVTQEEMASRWPGRRDGSTFPVAGWRRTWPRNSGTSVTAPANPRLISKRRCSMN
jgi:hypothetical protein